MWFLLLCCLWGPMPDPPPIPLSPGMKALMAGIPAANLADLVTTEMALRDGGLELNPLMRRPEVRYPLKAAATGLGMWGSKKLYETGNPTAAKTAAVLSIVIPLLAAGLNVKAMR